jgi:hypothetical protein
MVKRTDVMNLAKGFCVHPDELIGDGNGIVATGMPGAGKTALIARFFEEFDKFHIPGVLFDLEGDLATLVPYLKRGFLATATNCPTPRDIYGDGLTVVYNLATWRDQKSLLPDDATGRMIARTTSGIMREAVNRPPHLRVPFLIGLDEAAYWLPRSPKNCDHASEETMREILSIFQNIAIRGRKYGVVPFFFTQKYSMVHPEALTTGTFIFMKQTDKRELLNYIENINTLAFGPGDLTHKQIRTRFMTFKPGEAVVKLADGRQLLLRFFNRQSEHISHTPKVQAAMNLYAEKLAPRRNYGSYIDDETMEEATTSEPTKPQVTEISVAAQKKAQKKTADRSPVRIRPSKKVKDAMNAEGFTALSGPKRVQVLLTVDPSLRVAELAKFAGTDNSLASKARKAYFDKLA